MADVFIDKQIKTIEKATKSAVRNKKSALQFLRDAGIVKTDTTKKSKKTQ